jgi:hypothetical protein
VVNYADQVGLGDFNGASPISLRNFLLVRGCWFGGRVWVLISSNQLLDEGKC